MISTTSTGDWTQHCECERARVAAAAWQSEAQHWRGIAGHLEAQLDQLRSSGDRQRLQWRTRQTAHRRRHAFAQPASDGGLS